MLLDRVSAALNHVQETFDHPYISFLFYGVDAAGDFIPIKQLREKYNKYPLIRKMRSLVVMLNECSFKLLGVELPCGT